jgi:uncharacterized membrane protein YjjP (DUF1212 family)
MKNMIKIIKTKFIPHISEYYSMYISVLNFGLSLWVAFCTYISGNKPACIISCFCGFAWIFILTLEYQINFLIKEINCLIDEINKEG